MKAYKSIFKESRLFKESQILELSTLNVNDDIQTLSSLVSQAWPDDVYYNGKPIFDAYIKAVALMEDSLKQLARTRGFTSWIQECYLGYLLGTNKFYCGFDYEETDPEDEDGGGDGMSNAVYTLSFIQGSFRLIDKEIYLGKGTGFYDNRSAYDELHKREQNLLDLRLD
jgi:hypothetical protein